MLCTAHFLKKLFLLGYEFKISIKHFILHLSNLLLKIQISFVFCFHRVVNYMVVQCNLITEGSSGKLKSETIFSTPCLIPLW